MLLLLHPWESWSKTSPGSATAGFLEGPPLKQVRGTSQRLTGFRKPDWIMDHDLPWAAVVDFRRSSLRIATRRGDSLGVQEHGGGTLAPCFDHFPKMLHCKCHVCRCLLLSSLRRVKVRYLPIRIKINQVWDRHLTIPQKTTTLETCTNICINTLACRIHENAYRK